MNCIWFFGDLGLGCYIEFGILLLYFGWMFICLNLVGYFGNEFFNYEFVFLIYIFLWSVSVWYGVMLCWIWWFGWEFCYSVLYLLVLVIVLLLDNKFIFYWFVVLI